jgi:tetratricopeptide (TPR) repeat protein
LIAVLATSTTPCPDENTLVAFASGGLSVADAARIEEHLDACGVCFTLVAELARVDAEESDPTRMVPLIDGDSELAARGNTVIAPLPVSPGPNSVPRPTDASVPLQLGRYTVLHRLGQGAMGVVYAALDRELGRRVALKLIVAEGPDAAERGARLLREAQALARLKHPHVVTVYDAGRVDGQVFVSMELVPGMTMGDWLRARKRTWTEVIALMRQAAAGLQAAHDAGIIHRDFKPGNVLVDERDRAYVVDFGLSRAFGPVREDAQTVVRAVPSDPSSSLPGGAVPSPSDLSRSDVIAGTPAYMAPEQYEGHGDARMDQFAFCVVLYLALFDRRPFEGSDASQIHARIATGIAPDIPLGSDVPDWLARIVLKGLSKDPNRRFESMRALVDAIDLAEQQRRRNRGIAIAGAAAAAVGIAAVIVRIADAPGPCDDATARIADAWGREIAGKLEASLAAGGAPHVARSWTTATATLDRWAEGWRSTALAACAARDGSPAPTDPTELCLDRRVLQLRALTSAWAEPDAAIVDQLVRAAQALPVAEPCVEPVVWDGSALDPAARLAGARARDLLARARALASAGARGRGMPLVAQAVELASTLGERHPLVGEAQLALAEVLLLDARAGEAAGHVDFAVQTAITRDDPGLLARASALAARIALANGREAEAVLQMTAIGRAALGRIGCDTPSTSRTLCVDTWVELDLAAAAAQRKLGRYGDAITSLEVAAARIVADRGEQQLVLADVIAALAESRAAAMQIDVAIADHQRAREIREALLGGAHPEVAVSGIAIARLLLLLHRDAEARDEGQRALTVAERAFGASDPRVADALSQLGQAEAELGHIDLALANHRRALEIREAVGDTAPLAAALNQLGATLVTLGRWEEADSVLQRALQLATTAFGPAHLEVAAAHFQIGRVAHGRGDFARAVVELQAALLLRRTLSPPGDRLLGTTGVWLARAERDRGDLDAAELAAKAAMQVLDPAVDPDAWAHAQLVVADVGWARGDGARVRAEVGGAIATLRGQPGAAAPVAMLEAWQAARASDDALEVSP